MSAVDPSDVEPTADPSDDEPVEPPPPTQPPRGILFHVGEPIPEGHYICVGPGEAGVLACRVGDICCEEAGVCRAAGDVTDDNCSHRSACETNADCPASQECCRDSYFVEHMASGGRGPVKRRWCGTDCREAPLCRPGTCPPGSTCNLWEDPRQNLYAVGLCHRDDAEVACGPSNCTGTTPFCAWDSRAASGTCLAPDPKRRMIECDDHRDCGEGAICVLRNGWLTCCRIGSCFDHAFPSIPCAVDRDCKIIGGGRCELFPSGEMPPGIIGACRQPP